MDYLALDTNRSTSIVACKRFNKKVQQLNKKQFELQTYDEKLRHYADMRMKLDLEDGVKVNLGVFGDLLSNMKAITGSNND